MTKTMYWIFTLMQPYAPELLWWFQTPVPLHFMVYALGLWGARHLNTRALLVVWENVFISHDQSCFRHSLLFMVYFSWCIQSS